nr:zinc finger, CCHC-type, retrotransposon Gag domain protein [Tanacetum cinerariifolium]
VTTRNNPNDNVPNFKAMINVTVANALPNLTAALRTQITSDIKNGAEPSGGGGGDAIPHGIHFWIERFTKLKPLTFRSAATLAKAEDWITHMEKLFQDFWGQDQRSAGRNGNDRQGHGNYNQRQHRNQSTWDFNQGHAS